MAYYLIRTISGKETEVAEALSEITTFVDIAMCKKMRRLKRFRKHKEVTEPVLPCYVFAALTDEEYTSLRSVKNIVGVVEMSRRDCQDVQYFLDLARKGEFNHNGIYGDLMPGQIMHVIGGMFTNLHLSFDKVKDGRIHGEIGGKKVEIDAHDAEVQYG